MQANPSGDLAVAWVQGAGNGEREVVAQLLDEELQKIGYEEALSEESDRTLRHVGLCHDNRGWNAVWSDDLPRELVTGVMLDLGNVPARWSWPPIAEPVVRVNSNEIGAQTFPEIACLSSGQRVVTWSNACVAAQRVGNGVFYFEPPECEAEPMSGSLLQIFGSQGDAEGDLVVVAEGRSSRAPVASVGSAGDFVTLTGASIQTRSASGGLLDERRQAAVDFSSAALACTSARCAAAVADEDEGVLRVWLIDPSALESTSSIIVAEGSQPEPSRRLRVTNPSIACDSGSVCVVSWLLLSETSDGDQILTESLGVFARALDTESGELGPESMLYEPDITSTGVLLAAQGEQKFATAVVEDGLITISQLQVR